MRLNLHVCASIHIVYVLYYEDEEENEIKDDAGGNDDDDGDRDDGDDNYALFFKYVCFLITSFS